MAHMIFMWATLRMPLLCAGARSSSRKETEEEVSPHLDSNRNDEQRPHGTGGGLVKKVQRYARKGNLDMVGEHGPSCYLAW